MGSGLKNTELEARAKTRATAVKVSRVWKKLLGV